MLGAVHVGVLRALEEKKIRIDCLAGTSIGAVVAALYAFRVPIDDIEKFSKELKWLDITKVSLSRLGLMSNEKLGDLLIEHIGNKDIEDAGIPLRIVATDIASGEKVILEKGNLADAVRASACIPGIFKPVEINGTMLVDGGIVEHIPITPLKAMGADRIIAVQLQIHQAAKKPDHIVEVMLNTFEFMVNNISKPYLKDADILIKPNLSEFDKVNTNQVNDLITKGYNEAMTRLDQQSSDRRSGKPSLY